MPKEPGEPTNEQGGEPSPESLTDEDLVQKLKEVSQRLDVLYHKSSQVGEAANDEEADSIGLDIEELASLEDYDERLNDEFEKRHFNQVFGIEHLEFPLEEMTQREILNKVMSLLRDKNGKTEAEKYIAEHDRRYGKKYGTWKQLHG